MHSVSAGGVVDGLVDGVGVLLGVTDGVAFGDLSVPPGVSGLDVAVLDVAVLAGAGCGRSLGAGPAESPGLGWGSGGALALGLGWVLGSGAVDWPALWLAEAVPAAWLAWDPADACVPLCLLSFTA